MPDSMPTSLPTGLPARLCADDAGYEALCVLLGLTRTKAKQEFVNTSSAKRFLKSRGVVPPHAKQAKRLRLSLLAIFADPSMRRSMWRAYSDRAASGHKAKIVVRSLEHAALAAYDEGLLTSEPDHERLKECASFYSSHAHDDELSSPALAALPFVKSDLSGWAALSAERKRLVVVAAFAVASILNDSRILRWAAAREPEIDRDLPFLDTNADDTTVEKNTEPWMLLPARAQALVRAATALAASPTTTTDLFDAVDQCYADIVALRDAVITRSNAKAVDDLLGEFATLLRARVESAAWLGEEVDNLLDAWRTAYPATHAEVDSVRTEVARAAATLEPALSKVDKAQANANDANALRDQAASGGLSVANVEHLAELSDAATDALRALLEARQSCLTNLAPTARGAEQAKSSAAKSRAHDDQPQADRQGDHIYSEAGTGGEEERAKLAPAPLTTDHAREQDQPQIRGVPAQEALNHGTAAQRVTATKLIEPSEQGADASKPINPVLTRGAPDQQGAPDKFDDPADTAESDSTPPEVDQAPESETTGGLTAAQAMLWRAVGDGRLGLAYHIARLDAASDGTDQQPATELLAALAFGSKIVSPHDELANAYGRRIGVLGGMSFDDSDRPNTDALNVLLFAATLRPALFAAQQGASIPLLRRVRFSKGLSPVFRFATAIADHAERLQTVHLDYEVLSTMLDEDAWTDRIAAIGRKVTAWRSTAETVSFPFAPASHAWKSLLRKSGILGELARLLESKQSTDLQRVREITEILEDDKAVRELIHGHDVKQRKIHGNAIDGPALAQLRHRLEEPRELATEWSRTMAAKPDDSGFVGTTVASLRGEVEKLAPTALDAIRGIETESPQLTEALACASSAIERFIGLFRGECTEFGSATHVLTDDLLRIPALRIDSAGTITHPQAPADVLALLLDEDAHATTFAEAFHRRLGNEDLHGADAVCRRLDAEGNPAVDGCRELLDHALDEQRSVWRGRLYDLAELVEQTFVLGETTEGDRAKLTAMISAAADRLEHRDQSLQVGEDVAAITSAIEQGVANASAAVRKDLDAYRDGTARSEWDLVEAATVDRDLATLQEQLDCLRRGQPLQSPQRTDESHLDTFLAFISQAEAELENRAGMIQDDVVQAARRREDMLSLTFSQLTLEQSERSSALLDHWFHMARNPSVEPARAAGFFGGLGFSVIANVEPKREAQAELRTDPVRSRDLCPAHAFGSGAGGRYNVVFNWQGQAREPIIQALGSADPNVRTIVLHFGRLDRGDREWLRRWSIDQSMQFIAIDETLVLYLASLPSGTMRALFDCTLPFSCTEPYFTAPGLAPPESFFGRTGERSQITDPYGSCFVFGGRQLGKTALLHAAQVAFHNPTERRLSEYVDLKAQDVGIAKGAAHIWAVLMDVLIRLEVMAPAPVIRPGRERLVGAVEGAVRDWLAKHHDARMLLLLDEADAFLDADLRGDFPESTRLKGLMDATGRRFKIVFCGLHNVLRNTTSANHPLAHFGEPICVGPLLDNGDLRQARALVQEPMAAVGYRFESPNLVTQIMLWTNYYPSLIQLCGETLLRYLRQRPNGDFPYAITSDDVRAAFLRNQFREYLRSRFSLTLQLDQRYEVIAYAMVWEFYGNPDSLRRGLPIRDILDLVREHWRDGFNLSEHEFRTLLEEMCGLGVLRRSAGEHGAQYTFRNPNVVRLLGEDGAILNVLDKEREKPVLFEANAFHAQYPKGRPESPRRGPLTYEQENLLRRGGRVAVVCGSPAAGFADIQGFLDQRVERTNLLNLSATIDAGTLVRTINRYRPERETRICLVDEGDPWSLDWIARASDALRTTRRGHALRVVFRANPNDLWDRLIAHLPEQFLQVANDLFDWAPLHPWSVSFVRRWCADLGLHEAPVDALLELTGGWPLLLERYAESSETTWGGRKAEIEGYIAGHRVDILKQTGLDATACRHLALLRDADTLDRDDDFETCAALWEGNEPINADLLRRRVFWAMQLGLIQNDDGSPSFNPLVSRVLGDTVP